MSYDFICRHACCREICIQHYLFYLMCLMQHTCHTCVLWNCQSLAVVTVVLRGLDPQSHEHETGRFLFFLSLIYSCIFAHLFIFLSTYKSTRVSRNHGVLCFHQPLTSQSQSLYSSHINILHSLIAHKKKNSHCLIQFFIRIFLVYLIENTYMVTIGFGCWENRIAGTALK